ncbi:TPA: hypothetical protein ACGOWV_002161 [Streptococcus suis]
MYLFIFVWWSETVWGETVSARAKKQESEVTVWGETVSARAKKQESEVTVWGETVQPELRNSKARNES